MNGLALFLGILQADICDEDAPTRDLMKEVLM
jgi:hypothetical protein